MKIKDAALFEIAIPFRFTFRHALASRNEGMSVLVRLEDEDGNVGWGESAPRHYVTGETTRSALDALAADLVPPFLGPSYGSFDEVVTAANGALEGLPRQRHAAFCALELALLDLAGRAFGESCAAVAGPVVNDSFRFSGVISADVPEEARQACELVKQYGFTSVKLKVGLSREKDVEILRSAREILGESVGLRIDANCAWTAEEALESLEALAPFRLQGVEQPLQGDDIDGLVWLTARSPVPVITDESLASYEDARMLASRRACDVFNVRISKCGGLLNSVRIRELAREAGLRCMLGAQVGETAILSAAGRHFAAGTADLLFLEGSYGTILLETDIARQDLTIGPGGEARALQGPGLGVDIEEDRLKPFVSEHRVLRGR